MSSLFDTATPHPAGYREVEVRPLFEAPRDDLALVDVREPAELAGLLGHIDGVHRAPLSTVAEAVRDWPRQAPVVLVCRSGARSARAAAQLVGLGFTRVMNLRGGMLAWNTARLPVVRTHPAPLPSVEAVRDALFQGLHQLLVHTAMPRDASTAVGGPAAHEGSARRDDSARTVRPADSGAVPVAPLLGAPDALPAHRVPSSSSPTLANSGASDAPPAHRVPSGASPTLAHWGASDATPAHRAPSSSSPTLAHWGASDATPARRAPSGASPTLAHWGASDAPPAHRVPSGASPALAHLGASDALPAHRVPASSAPPSREAAGAREHRGASSAPPSREAAGAHEHRGASSAVPEDAPTAANHTPEPPSRLALAAVLDALQAARPPDIRDAAAFDVLLRDLKDQLAVAQARPEGLT